MKELLAQAVASRVVDGQTVGFGSGTTAEAAVREIGKRIANERIRVRAMATSQRVAELADEVGVTVLSPFSRAQLDWAFDGADEVDPKFALIKGRGAAMVSEKLVALRAKSFVIIVTEDKLVKRLGEKFAIPVAILPEALTSTREALSRLGATEVVVREGNGKYGPVISDQGHLVLDVRFAEVTYELEKLLKAIPGVIDSGLFVGYATEVLVAAPTGVYSLSRA